MENIDKMKENHFKLKYNGDNEEWCVVKEVDELTKNHRELETSTSGVIPENKTDPLCPVQSFHTYIEHLNLDSDYMWQYPLEKINPEQPNVWYSKKHLGRTPCRHLCLISAEN